MRKFYSRIHPRWKQCDYRLAGMYFATTITFGRAPLFGALARDRCVLAPSGMIARDTWTRVPERFPGVELDAFVVMPDHVHALIVMPERPEPGTTSLSDVIGWAKSRSAHQINAMRGTPGTKVWQTSFHDSIVRTPEGRDRVRRYIEANPSRAWLRHCRRRT